MYIFNFSNKNDAKMESKKETKNTIISFLELNKINNFGRVTMHEQAQLIAILPLTHTFNKRIDWIQIKKPYMKSAAYSRYPQCAASAAVRPPIV